MLNLLVYASEMLLVHKNGYCILIEKLYFKRRLMVKKKKEEGSWYKVCCDLEYSVASPVGDKKKTKTNV